MSQNTINKSGKNESGNQQSQDRQDDPDNQNQTSGNQQRDSQNTISNRVLGDLDENENEIGKFKKFEDKLFQQQKMDYHLHFFTENNKLTKIQVPIVSVYDKKSHVVWNKYNSENKVPCEQVIIYRDGTWEPLLPRYLQSINMRVAKQLNVQEPPQKVKGARNMEQIKQKQALKKQRFVLLEDFIQEQYDEYLRQYKKYSKRVPNLQNIFLEDPNFRLQYKHINDLIEDTAFSNDLLMLYLNYIKDVFKVEYELNIQYYMLKIKSYDQFTKNAVYETFSEHILDNQEIKVYIFMIYCDQRWILGLFQKGFMQCRIIDFLDKDLSSIQQDEVINILISVIKKELKLKLQKQNFRNQDQCQKIGFYIDNGLNQCAYLHKYLYKVKENIYMEFDISYLEKEKFKKQFTWLVFKFGNSEMFVDEEVADQRIQKKLLERKEKLIKSNQKILKNWQFQGAEKQKEEGKYNKNENLNDKSQLTIHTYLNFSDIHDQQPNLDLSSSGTQNNLQDNQYQSQQQQQTQFQTRYRLNQESQPANINQNGEDNISDYTKTQQQQIEGNTQKDIDKKLKQEMKEKQQINIDQEELVDTLEKYKKEFKQRAMNQLKHQHPELQQQNEQAQMVKELQKVQQNRAIKEEIKKLLDEQDKKHLMNKLNALNGEEAEKVLMKYYEKQNLKNPQKDPNNFQKQNPYNFQLGNSKSAQNLNLNNNHPALQKSNVHFENNGQIHHNFLQKQNQNNYASNMYQFGNQYPKDDGYSQLLQDLTMIETQKNRPIEGNQSNRYGNYDQDRQRDNNQFYKNQSDVNQISKLNYQNNQQWRFGK